MAWFSFRALLEVVERMVGRSPGALHLDPPPRRPFLGHSPLLPGPVGRRELSWAQRTTPLEERRGCLTHRRSGGHLGPTAAWLTHENGTYAGWGSVLRSTQDWKANCAFPPSLRLEPRQLSPSKPTQTEMETLSGNRGFLAMSQVEKQPASQGESGTL